MTFNPIHVTVTQGTFAYTWTITEPELKEVVRGFYGLDIECAIDEHAARLSWQVGNMVKACLVQTSKDYHRSRVDMSQELITL